MEKVSLDVFLEEEPMETVRSPTKGSTKKMLWKMHGMELQQRYSLFWNYSIYLV